MFGLFYHKKRRAVKFKAHTSEAKPRRIEATVDVAFADSMPHDQIKKQIAKKMRGSGYPPINVSTMKIIDMCII